MIHSLAGGELKDIEIDSELESDELLLEDNEENQIDESMFDGDDLFDDFDDEE